MPDSRIPLTIQPPLAGISRKAGFQNQPPFSAYNSSNFWPIDVDDGRAVSATRPALSNPAAPGSTAEGLVPVNGRVSGKPFQSLVAASGGSIYWWDDTAWNLAGGSAASSADTGQAVYGAPFLMHALICKQGSVPIDFDYRRGTAELMVAAAGTIPEDCRMAATWQGCLCLAGQLTLPHVLYVSRTGNQYDFDFLAPIEDEGGAFTTAGDDEGLLNGPITALIAHTSDTLVVSTVEGIVAFRGHPRRGGVPEMVSGSSYILGQGAWAKTPGDRLYFITKQGLSYLDPQSTSVAVGVSQKAIPDELIGLAYDLEDPQISMVYDSRWHGLLIFARTDEEAWFYELDTGGFHRLNVDNYPFVLYEHKPFLTTEKSGVLLGRSA